MLGKMFKKENNVAIGTRNRAATRVYGCAAFFCDFCHGRRPTLGGCFEYLEASGGLWMCDILAGSYSGVMKADL